MSISSGLLGLWQEVARSDSWATESRSARCAEDWTAEAGEGQLVRLRAGCSGGEGGLSEGAAQHARVALSRGCAHGSQRSNAATQRRPCTVEVGERCDVVLRELL